MNKIKFNYEGVCNSIPAGIKTEDEKYQNLIEVCVEGSKNTIQSTEFQNEFNESSNSIKTQVEMYGFLAKDVCQRIKKGVDALDLNKEPLETLQAGIKNLYFILSTQVPIQNNDDQPLIEYEGMPLLVAYMTEQLFNNTSSENIKKHLNYYLTTLGVKEDFDKQGQTKELLFNLEQMVQ